MTMFVPFSIFEPNALNDFVDLESVPSRRSLRPSPFIEAVRRSISFDHVTIAGLNLPGYELGNGRSIDTEMPALMMERYYEKALHRTDPLVLGCRRAEHAITEDEAYAQTPPPNELLRLTRDFEVFHRILIPITSGGSVYGGVGFSRQEAFSEDEITHFELLAPALHGAATRQLMERFAAQHLRLTLGELECLRLASQGLTTQEIAAATGFQPRTVDSYIKASAEKLKSHGRLGATCEALRRGLIH